MEKRPLAVPPQKKEKEKGGGAVLTLVLLLLILALLGGFAYCYMNDYFGVRSAIVHFFITQDEQYETSLAQLEERMAQLEAWETTLEERER